MQLPRQGGLLLIGMCQVQSVVHKATIKMASDEKDDTDQTARTFKQLLMRYSKYRNNTSLAKHVQCHSSCCVLRLISPPFYFMLVFAPQSQTSNTSEVNKLSVI